MGKIDESISNPTPAIVSSAQRLDPSTEKSCARNAVTLVPAASSTVFLARSTSSLSAAWFIRFNGLWL